MSQQVNWAPAELFNDPPVGSRSPFALVILNVPLENLTIVKKLASSAEYCIAADGAANRIYESYPDASQFENDVWKEFHLSTIIGDLDSIRPLIRSKFLSLENPPEIINQPDQESTDFTKAVLHTTSLYPHLPIIVIGSLFGRIDQAMSQLHHLFMFSSTGSHPLPPTQKIYLITDTSICWVLESGFNHLIQCWSERHRLMNYHVGIIPMVGQARISTEGLQWDVEDWVTGFGGRVSTSNRVDDDSEDGVVEVVSDRDVLFTIDMVKEEEVRFNIKRS